MGSIGIIVIYVVALGLMMYFCLLYTSDAADEL